MSDVVIDASAALAWLFGEEQAQAHEARLGDFGLVAPSLWRLEVVNAVLVKERRGNITAIQGNKFLQILEAMEIDIAGELAGPGLKQLAVFARPHQLTAYDAAYLELAIEFGLPLWTYDRNMQDAAKRLGVSLLVEEDA
jgi:predicted nucleic acid-binding protein